MNTYKIVRMYFNDEHDDETIETGLTEAEARAYCRNPNGSSKTCQTAEGAQRTQDKGAWFEGYDEE
jgi:hypothetical protein